MQKIMKQLVFLSILLESRNKVALRGNARAKDAAVRNRYLTEPMEKLRNKSNDIVQKKCDFSHYGKTKAPICIIFRLNRSIK